MIEEITTYLKERIKLIIFIVLVAIAVFIYGKNSQTFNYFLQRGTILEYSINKKQIPDYNMMAEKQFRNPTEYGAPRPNSATFTSTGAAVCMLTKEKTEIRVESATLGKIIDYEQNDPNDMGRVMAPAVIDTLSKHLEDGIMFNVGD